MSKALEQSLAEAALAVHPNIDVLEVAALRAEVAQLRQERDDWKLAFETSNEAVAETPASTQRNPSPVDMSAPDWLARYAVPLEGQDD